VAESVDRLPLAGRRAEFGKRFRDDNVLLSVMSVADEDHGSLKNDAIAVEELEGILARLFKNGNRHEAEAASVLSGEETDGAVQESGAVSIRIGTEFQCFALMNDGGRNVE